MSKNSKIQPFEWLTSPESIGGFVQEHVLNQAACGESSKSDNDSQSKPTAMHIGCGSSTVGEYLVREMGFSKVVNVDRDRETLEGMAERWSEMENKNTDEIHNEDQGDEKKDDGEKRKPVVLIPSDSATPTRKKMEFWCLDYTSEVLPKDYGDSFDLVVDKSTLDCTLCSDCTATAAFLCEIYRTLTPNNGIYLVISFHELDLILPLLRDLPGAHWSVSHTTMERQVENIQANEDGRRVRTQITPASLMDSENDSFHGGIINRKPLNVLIARKMPESNGNDALSSPLVLENIVHHVQEINDRWFQDEQPLLTTERIEDLKASFFGTETDSKRLSLQEAYRVMFTDAEREHLTYEYFLEDWEAFYEEEIQKEKQAGRDMVGKDNYDAIITYELALSFLRANQ